MFRRILCLCSMIIIGISAGPLIADSGQPKTHTPVTRSELKSLIDQYAISQQRFEETLAKSKTPEERTNVKETLRPKPVPGAIRFVDWAERNSKDQLAADLLVLIVVHGGKTEPAMRAAALLVKDHLDLDSERFFQAAVAVTGNLPPHDAETWTRVFVDHGSSRQTQALACVLLAKFKMGLVRYAQLLQNPRFAEAMESQLDIDLLKHLKKLDVAKTNAEAELLFERLMTEFADVKSRGQNLAQAVKPDYFAISKLAIGKVAPEIDGEDLDGKRMTLSSYRGKVVVLCFWGTWCKPCIKMLPHHNELVAKHQDDTFAFLGVATDKDREKIDKTVKSQGIRWQNWWDGGDSGHPISEKWSINQWPTIIVLDHKGIIRHKHLVGEQLDAAVAGLLNEMQKPSSP
ncbi:Thiol-disulfide oxidoreductase ResA [Symmachiella macrocystis]|uniref:Thiol-disulfide oxidoreductase ResA n=1 Tax=Symmachiella macrocystis TaxID=2527985 RepID=A0A5C6B6T9_9PLAN|nr:TlpA disulfide reductase family protein [Symmachiella macrocystis]TWU07049.1 Thiol-disulfide oxidoreductase ResA [Symmachiella macrocystis]